MTPKKIIFAVLVVVLALTVTGVDNAQAQTLVRQQTILFNAKQLAAGTGDSLVGIPLEYNGTYWPTLVGKLPDSITVTGVASNDSTYDIQVRYKLGSMFTSPSGSAATKTSGVYTCILWDSVVSSSAVQTVKLMATTLKPSTYAPYDLFGLSIYAYNAGGIGAKVAATASKLYFVLTRWYHITSAN